jgi:hypothetical protein
MARQEYSVTVKSKRGRGRPSGIKKPSSVVRLPDDLLLAVHDWAAKRVDKITTAEAIRHLVEKALAKR